MSTNRPFINEYRQWREETFRRSNSPIVSYEDWLNSNYPDHYNELMGNASRGEVLRRRNEDRRGRTVPPDNILRAAYDLYLREFPAHAGEEPRTYVEWINIAEIHDNRFIRNAIDASNADQLRGRTFDTVIIDEHIEWNNERHPASRRYTLPHTGTYVISTPNGDETWIRPERDGTPNIQFPSVLNSTREENHTLFNEYMEYVRNTGNGASFLNFESWHRRTYNLPNRSPIEDVVAQRIDLENLRSRAVNEMQRAMRDQILYGQGAVRVETDENNNPSIERIDMHAENLFDEMNAPSTARPMSPSPNPKLTDNVYQYLDQLQASAGRRLLTDELKLFEGLTNKLDINRIFFGLPKAGAPEPLSEEKIKKLTDHYAAIALTKNNELMRSLERTANQHLSAANDFSRRVKESLELMAKAQNDIAALTLKTPDYSEVINKAMQNPFWTLHDVTQNTVNFVSNEIIVSDKRPKLGIDMTVNFGRIMLKWDTARNYISADKFEKNLVFGSNYYHPHISSSNDFCFGNASSTITKALKETKIDEVLTVMQALLTTYNPDSPYVPLSDFFMMQNPEELRKGECAYLARGEVRFRDEYIGDIRPRTIDTDVNEDGEEILRCRYYQMCNVRYNTPVNETHYFLANNNRYIEFDHNDEDLVYEWD